MSRNLSLFALAVLGSLRMETSTSAEEFHHLEYGNEAHFHAQASGGSHQLKYAPDRLIDVLNHAINVTPDFESRGVSGRVTITFKPIAKPLPELRLDGVDLRVSVIESSAGILDWQNTGEELVVTFAPPIPAGQESWVRVDYSVEKPEKGLYFRTPSMGYKPEDMHLWTQGEMIEARHWFPCYDYPNEKFTTEMICQVPDGMVALSNGELVSQNRDPNTGLVVWHWKQDKPHVNYLITLCAGYFESIEDLSGPVPMRFWTPPSQINTASNSFAGTREMMKFFIEETGVDYPWARYDQVVVDDFTWGGMENTSQTTLTDRTLFPDELQGTRSSEGLVAHELAHQWFGDLVTMKDWANVWLNEGFATYYDALYHEHAYGRDRFLYEMLGNARSVWSQQNDVLPMVYRGYDQPVEQFGYRAYPKGSWILHMLRSELGPELFRQVVKTYLERHAYDVVITEDLVAVVNELSGRDWDRFFGQYVYHAHHPELKVSWSWNAAEKLAKVSIEQTQTLSETVLLFDIEIPVRFKSGTNVFDGVAHVTQASEDFYFAVPFKPELVRVDPDFTWLAEVSFSIPTEMLYLQLADTSDVVGRVFACEQLAKKSDRVTIEKLQHALNNDPFWGVRVEAAEALREIHNDEAREALVASTDQADDRVRREVNRGIAAFFDESTPGALIGVIENESNPDLVSDAIRALAPYSAEQVGDVLLGFLDSNSYRNILFDAATAAMSAQRDPVYLPRLLATLAEREAELNSRSLASSLSAVSALGAELEATDQVREFLLGFVNHPKNTVQLAAIRALGTLNDPRAIAVLETFTTGGPGSDVRRAAEEALNKIRASRPQSVEVNTLRDEVMKLREQSGEIKEQVEEMKKRLDAGGAPAEGDEVAETGDAGRRRGLFGGAR